MVSKSQMDMLDNIPSESLAEDIFREYLVVSDVNSKVVLSSADYNEAVRLANRIRACGGQVTIFKALKA